MRAAKFTAILVLTLAAPFSGAPQERTIAEWPFYGGDAGGTRYSRLGEINRSNVAQLKVAWEYHTGDVSAGTDGHRKSAFETTPVVANGIMYFTTPFLIRGTPNLGGPIVTTGGLVFVAAAMDNYLRAFDVETGTELWKTPLPAGGQATPMTYRLRPDGKQFVVIAAGGHGRLGTKLGDSLIAFALP